MANYDAMHQRVCPTSSIAAGLPTTQAAMRLGGAGSGATGACIMMPCTNVFAQLALLQPGCQQHKSCNEAFGGAGSEAWAYH
eukprot:100908-Pelagomonas_calceolata.AAC.5